MSSPQFTVNDIGCCDFCSSIDFARLFTSDLRLYELKHSHVKWGDCASCNLFRDAYFNVVNTNLGNPSSTRMRNVVFAQHCSNDFKPLHPNSPESLHYRILLGTADGPTAAIDRAVPGCDLKILHHDDTVSEHLLWRRPILPQAKTELLFSWLSTCRDSHGHSRPPRNDENFGDGWFRVIDVVNRRVVAPDTGRYVALSYVWGDVFTHFSRDVALDSYGFLQMDALPRTLVDAVTVTERLGERYLWVDWLCLNQDDPSELKKAIPQMDAVYSQAEFTIVAAAGRDANAGLPGVRPGSRKMETLTRIRQTTHNTAPSSETQEEDLYLMPARPSIHSIVGESHWSKRGWTFQEYLLSSRCLFFTEREIFYSCPSAGELTPTDHMGRWTGFDAVGCGYWREAYILESASLQTAYQSHIDWSNGWDRSRDPLLWTPLSGLDRTLMKPALKFDRYAQLAIEYSKRTLGSAEDVIAAFTGILTRMWSPDELGTALLHGLPRSQITAALLWHSHSPNKFNRRRLPASRPDIPSWSWAGWFGAIRYDTSAQPVGFSSSHASSSLRTSERQTQNLLHGRHERTYQPSYETRPKAGHLLIQRGLEPSESDYGECFVYDPDHVNSDGAETSGRSFPGIQTRPEKNELLFSSYVLEVYDAAPKPATFLRDLGIEEGSFHIDSNIEFAHDPDEPQPRERWGLVVIADGVRKWKFTTAGDRGGDSRWREYVCLIVELHGNYAERRGIACIPVSCWDRMAKKVFWRWGVLR